MYDGGMVSVVWDCIGYFMWFKWIKAVQASLVVVSSACYDGFIVEFGDVRWQDAGVDPSGGRILGLIHQVAGSWG